MSSYAGFIELSQQNYCSDVQKPSGPGMSETVNL